MDLPNKQDIVFINFDPSTGREIRKRRPAVVVSNQAYNRQTGLIAICPITHTNAKRIQNDKTLIPLQNQKVDGFVNPLQLYTFDYTARKAEKVDVMNTWTFQQVVQLIQFIF
ncbi:hypothetical protein RsY01_1308 [Lactococcus reticulitermitis]|uniref:Uncharacterized protein n=2 Tax=Pseudolactococcus reticulitermitis TaxID=2025039 RepID=A0A224X0F1_9LACT|nr:hypothetical protein RsY01_1308 [Lactococcus reticulitermitis]